MTVVRTDLLKWASKQSKQVLSGFPALAALTCIEEQGQLVSAIDGFIDQLHKQLREKKTASMAVSGWRGGEAWCYLSTLNSDHLGLLPLYSTTHSCCASAAVWPASCAVWAP